MLKRNPVRSTPLTTFTNVELPQTLNRLARASRPRLKERQITSESSSYTKRTKVNTIFTTPHLHI